MRGCARQTKEGRKVQGDKSVRTSDENRAEEKASDKVSKEYWRRDKKLE